MADLKAAIEEGQAFLGTPEEQEARRAAEQARQAEHQRWLAETQQKIDDNRQRDLERPDINTTPSA